MGDSLNLVDFTVFCTASRSTSVASQGRGQEVKLERFGRIHMCAENGLAVLLVDYWSGKMKLTGSIDSGDVEVSGGRARVACGSY